MPGAGGGIPFCVRVFDGKLAPFRQRGALPHGLQSRCAAAPTRRYLYDPGMPDVDLFLRPSGEKRTSNFLLWQSAYAEMVYQDKLFPDFTPQDLYDAVAEYARRDRRFGGTK